MASYDATRGLNQQFQGTKQALYNKHIASKGGLKQGTTFVIGTPPSTTPTTGQIFPRGFK